MLLFGYHSEITGGVKGEKFSEALLLLQIIPDYHTEGRGTKRYLIG
jgi:hypothetical protein